MCCYCFSILRHCRAYGTPTDQLRILEGTGTESSTRTPWQTAQRGRRSTIVIATAVMEMSSAPWKLHQLCSNYNMSFTEMASASWKSRLLLGNGICFMKKASTLWKFHQLNSNYDVNFMEMSSASWKNCLLFGNGICFMEKTSAHIVERQQLWR